VPEIHLVVLRRDQWSIPGGCGFGQAIAKRETDMPGG
jgi:hypothetical protein